MENGKRVICCCFDSSNRLRFVPGKICQKRVLELVSIARPKMIYRRKNMYFFAFDGFVMYSDQCEERDFSEKILDTIEFSNQQWNK